MTQKLGLSKNPEGSRPRADTELSLLYAEGGGFGKMPTCIHCPQTEVLSGLAKMMCSRGAGGVGGSCWMESSILRWGPSALNFPTRWDGNDGAVQVVEHCKAFFLP